MVVPYLHLAATRYLGEQGVYDTQVHREAKRNGSRNGWRFSTDLNTAAPIVPLALLFPVLQFHALQFPAQQHPSPVVLLVPTGFVVLAIVSLGGTLKTVSHVASRPTNVWC